MFFPRVIVNKAHYSHIALGVPLNLAQDHGAGVARAGNENRDRGGGDAVWIETQNATLLRHTERQPGACQEGETTDRFQQPDGTRGAVRQPQQGQEAKVGQGNEHRGGDARGDNAAELVHTGVTPQAIIQVETQIERDADQRRDDKDRPTGGQISTRSIRRVKA